MYLASGGMSWCGDLHGSPNVNLVEQAYIIKALQLSNATIQVVLVLKLVSAFWIVLLLRETGPAMNERGCVGRQTTLPCRDSARTTDACAKKTSSGQPPGTTTT